jgi:hypothetical protein
VNDRTVLPGLSLADSDYAKRMLSDDAPAFIVATMWNEDFGGQPVPGAVSTHFVPVSRYDLSGYGASIFSDFQYHGGLYRHCTAVQRAWGYGPDAVAAVAESAGQRVPRPDRPKGLTGREAFDWMASIGWKGLPWRRG